MELNNNTLIYVISIVVIFIIILIAINYNRKSETMTDISNNSNSLIAVQNGIMRPVRVDLCQDGTLPTCYGQNPNTPYIIADFGNYAETDTSEEAFLGAFNMTNDQAVVVHGQSPPESAYWSLIPYLYRDNKCGDVALFATISDSFKMLDINDGAKFNRKIAVIYSCNPCLMENLTKLYTDLGYYVHPNPIPQYPNDAQYFILGRVSGFASEAAKEAYLDNTNLLLTKYEDKGCFTTNMTTSVTLRKRSTEGSEYLKPGIATFNVYKAAVLNAFNNAYPAFSYKMEVPTKRFRQDINYDSGFDCITNCIECLGDNRDTVYTIAQVKQLFTVSDVIIIVGVNHNITGKSMFTQIGVYDLIKQFGIYSVDIFDKSHLFYAVIMAKVPLDMNKLRLPKYVKPYFYQIPSDVKLIAITERAYVQTLGNPKISADPSTLIPPFIQLRSATNLDTRQSMLENIKLKAL